MGGIFGKESDDHEKIKDIAKFKVSIDKLDREARAIADTLVSHHSVIQKILEENASQRAQGPVDGGGSPPIHKHLEVILARLQNSALLQMENLVGDIFNLKMVVNNAIETNMTGRTLEVQRVIAELRSLSVTSPMSLESPLCSHTKDQYRELEMKYQNLCENVRSAGIKLERLRNEEQKLSKSGKDFTSIYKKASELEQKLREKEKTIEELRKTESENNIHINRLKSKNNDLEKEKQYEIANSKKHANAISEEKRAIENMLRESEDRLRKCKRENSQQEKRIKDLMKSNEELQRILKEKQTLKVQLYYRHGDLTSAVVNELCTQLDFHGQTQNTCINVMTCTERQGIVPGIPLIVICINASRLGTDVTRSIQDVPATQKTSVAIMHHKAKHALPQQTSDRVLTAPEYKQLGGLFDMAFLSTEGIYPCDMNNRALENIFAFIKRHQ